MTEGKDELEALSNAYWSGRAPEYSGLHMAAFNTEKADRFRERVREVCERALRPGGRVRALDLGCGSGFMSLILLDAGCSVVGIDFSEAMLAQARANAAGEGFDCCEFIHMRAQELDFPNCYFDLVVTRNVTWILQDVDQVYAEVMRVLAPGGYFLNLDANYGRAFNEADARGEVPKHPTQSLEQLRTRNEVARGLDITYVDRPQWDIAQFWTLGASSVLCERFGGSGGVGTSDEMFALEVRK